MDKVNVVTYCTSTSYGSVFQALGLKKALQMLGVESCILQAEKRPDSAYRNRIHGKPTKKKLAVWALRLFIHEKLKRRYIKMNQFISDHLDIQYYGDYPSLAAKGEKKGIFIAGSDQIWNPRNMTPEFFLRFVDEDAKKISYAASMGVTEVAEDRREQFAAYVRDFDHISVREMDNVPVVAACTDKPVQVHIDPTFLVDRRIWSGLSSEYRMEKPYILVYPLFWNKAYNQKLEQLHRQTGMEIVVISDFYRDIFATQWVYDADPGQFLRLVENAEAVVSSSFHGVAMSIIFNKRVAAVVNPAAPSRIDSLLKTLHYPHLTIEDLWEDKPVDFETVNRRIGEERSRSMDYLKETVLGHE